MVAYQLDFGFNVERISDLEVATQHHARCEHDAESVTPLIDQYRRVNSGRQPLVSGVKYIATGTDKVVYSLPCSCHVLKIDRGLHSYGDQVAYEINVWEEVDDDLRPYLCPIDAYGDNWIVMRRADTRLPREYREDLADQLDDALRRRLGIRDFHADNVGELNGRPVLIDYGLPEDRSSDYSEEAA